ncbi:hypothetical protein JRO89_XS15G0124100 [Xanthoceras sorbifolium]|uniref:Uncharacterized protein n=1 Tax=Xanthoceras sorbifolium TaxID=99658 RepID=A0ABQ8H1X4_9ROSI|nr:hypothetical protein JRO89_XS15G0124100 [Xanthoceras sorbifolium]
MASLSPQTLLSLSKPNSRSFSTYNFLPSKLFQSPSFSRNKQRNHNNSNWVLYSVVQEELDVIPVKSQDSTDMQEGVVVGREDGTELAGEVSQVGGFSDGTLSFEGFSSATSSSSSMGDAGGGGESEEIEKLIDRTINATLVLAAGTFAITKLLTIDQDYWHSKGHSEAIKGAYWITDLAYAGVYKARENKVELANAYADPCGLTDVVGWTIYEILRYAPQHNWIAYEEALKTNPVLAKMMISGVVYSLGDWIAQCYEGKPLFEFDRARMFRSGLVGFTLHGSLSHYYYQFCEELFPFQDWWVVPAKVVFDQTVWAAAWNSIYYTVLGFLRLESPLSVFSELRATFWPMLTAGWKLWPFAHLVTYGLIPVEQRLLWVDCVELIWVTILSTYSNEKSEARISEAPTEAKSNSLPIGPPEVFKAIDFTSIFDVLQFIY